MLHNFALSTNIVTYLIRSDVLLLPILTRMTPNNLKWTLYDTKDSDERSGW